MDLTMLHRWLLLFTLAAAVPAAAAGELLENQVFERYSPLAAADEFSRRVFSPTTFDRLQRFQQHIGKKPIEQTVDLAAERYDIWVPETRPQRRMRLVYSTGGIDTPNRVLDARGRQEMRWRCVAGTFDVSQRRLDHWVPTARTLRKAIERLDTALSAAELQAHEACMPALMAQVDADLTAAEAAFAAGHRARAGELLGAADIAWGGLATERLVKLARLLAP